MQVTVVDMASFAYPKPPPWRVPRRFERFSNPVHSMFSSIGIEYIDGKSIKGGRKIPSEKEKKRLKIAVVSNAVSALKMLRPKRLRPGHLSFAVLEKYLTVGSERALGTASKIIRELKPSRVYILNSRFPQQKAALIAAEEQNSDIWFLEIYLGKLYRRRYPPQNRIATQKDLEKMGSKLKTNELLTSTQSWISEFSNAKAKNNQFKVIEPSSSKRLPGSGRDLVIFPMSSTDEFASVEFENDRSSWSSQLDAFIEAWRLVRKTDQIPILKLHPNFLNKNPLFLLSELSKVRRFLKNNPEFMVVRSASKISTYELLPRAALVVVHNSTVGLEASIRGIPVVCTNLTAYDLIADVVRFHGPQDHKLVADLPARSDPKGAMVYVTASEQLNIEIPLFEDRVELRDYSRIKQLIRSLKDASFFSIVFEQRWRLHKRANRAIETMYLRNLKRI